MRYQAFEALLTVMATVPLDGESPKNAVVKLVGNLFIALLAIRGGIAIWRGRLLDVIGLGALAALCAVFIYTPDLFREVGEAAVKVLRGQ